MRLFNDPRFIMLSDFEQNTYIKLIALAKQTHNHIKKDYPTIKAYLRTDQPISTVRATIKHLLSNFEDLSQNNYNIWFNKWDERYSYGGVEKEKEKEKEYYLGNLIYKKWGKEYIMIKGEERLFDRRSAKKSDITFK